MPRSPLCSTVTMDEAKYIYREACGEHAGFTGLKKSNFLTALAGIGRTAWLRLVPSDANVVREYDSKAACEWEKRISLGVLVLPIVLSCLCYTCKLIEQISLGSLVFGFLVLPIILS